jgi:uncharacterized protein
MLETLFEPHPFLTSGHAQTIAGAFLRRRFALPIGERRLFRVEQETQLMAHCHWQAGKRKDVPVIVIVHGLEGSSESNYVVGIAEKAYQQGFHAVRLNQRNCGGTEELTPTLYNSAMSADYRRVLEELANGDGFEQIFFAGYSMGGNLVTKMAGEYGENAPKALRGVATVCPAIDLAACADALELRENYLYQRHFVKGLMSRYTRKRKIYPQKYQENGIGAVRTVRQFDEAIIAPQFGYRNANHYYEMASSKAVVARVRVPLLLITSEDDPFVPYVSFLAAEVEKNPAIRFVHTRRGGHCGYISRQTGAERHWAEQRVVEFCAKLAAA